MILECIEDLYFEDWDNGEKYKCFSQGNLYEVHDIDNERNVYKLTNDNIDIQYVSRDSEKFKRYNKNLFLIIFKDKGNIMVRAENPIEALKIAGVKEYDLEIIQVDEEVLENGKRLSYRPLYQWRGDFEK